MNILILGDTDLVKVLYQKSVSEYWEWRDEKINEKNWGWNEIVNVWDFQHYIDQQHNEKWIEYSGYTSKCFLKAWKPDDTMVSAKDVK